MPKYRKKVREVTACQWTGTTDEDAITFCTQHNLPNFKTGTVKGVFGLVIKRSDGVLVARQNDYIREEKGGDFYPIDPGRFNGKWELVP